MNYNIFIKDNKNKFYPITIEEIKNDMKNRIKKILDIWRKYVANEFENTIAYLERNLESVDLVGYDGKISIIYGIKMFDGEIDYYEGGNPKELFNPSQFVTYFDDDEWGIIEELEEPLKIDKSSRTLPKPSTERIRCFEKTYRVELPVEYNGEKFETKEV